MAGDVRPVDYWADALKFTTPGGTTHIPCGNTWTAEALSDVDLHVLTGLLHLATRRIAAERRRRARLEWPDDDTGDDQADAPEPRPAVGFVALLERQAADA